MYQFIRSIAVGLAVLCAGSASATTINFNSVPTNTTYISSGLLLGSGPTPNLYEYGSCGAGAVGCLGPANFNGSLVFRFVAPNTTQQSHTTSVSFTSCHACMNRGSTAAIYDSQDKLLVMFNLGAPTIAVEDHTFSFAAADIAGIRFYLGADAIETITFDTPAAAAAVPEPVSIALLGLGLAGLAASCRKQ